MLESEGDVPVMSGNCGLGDLRHAKVALELNPRCVCTALGGAH
jgi:hypothetical protein